MQKSLSARLAVLLIGLIWFSAQNAMSLGLVIASLSGHTVEATQDHGSHIHLMLGHASGATHADDDHPDRDHPTCGDCSAGHHIDIQPADPATPDSKIKSQLLLLALILPLAVLMLVLPRPGRPRPSWPQPHRNSLTLLRRSVVLRH